jgi:hypothetical protein
MGMDQEGDSQPQGVAWSWTVHALSIIRYKGANRQATTAQGLDETL